MRRGHGWLTGLTVLVLASDLAVVAVRRSASPAPRTPGSAASARPTRRTRPEASAPSSTELEVEPPGQAEVSGRAVAITADDAVAPPLGLPVTITAERGQGRATITGAIVDGSRVTVAWNSGTPLPVSGSGALDLGPVHLDIGPAGIVWYLDGQPRGFTAGRYHLGASVAVGARGLATSRDSLDFTADAQTALITSGGVTVHLGGAALGLQGPGRLVLRGSFVVRTDSTQRPARAVSFGPGSFTLLERPTADGFVVEATLAGPLQTT